MSPQVPIGTASTHHFKEVPKHPEAQKGFPRTRAGSKHAFPQQCRHFESLSMSACQGP